MEGWAVIHEIKRQIEAGRKVSEIARELGVDVPQSVISITRYSFNGGWLWRVNYGPKDYIGRRGGDLIVEVHPSDARIEQVLWGQ